MHLFRVLPVMFCPPDSEPKCNVTYCTLFFAMTRIVKSTVPPMQPLSEPREKNCFQLDEIDIDRHKLVLMGLISVKYVCSTLINMMPEGFQIHYVLVEPQAWLCRIVRLSWIQKTTIGSA